MRGRVLPLAIAVAAALLAGGCGEDDDAPPAPPRPAEALQQAPRLVGGGPDAFLAQVRELRGTPIVVNQWASWCGPCRYEFPFFRALARKYRGRVAFLGVNADDGRAAGERFLRENPVPFPSFFDPDLKISREFKGGFAWPTTAYFDRRGRVVETHAGVYRSEADLEADIRRYALGS